MDSLLSPEHDKVSEKVPGGNFKSDDNVDTEYINSDENVKMIKIMEEDHDQDHLLCRRLCRIFLFLSCCLSCSVHHLGKSDVQYYPTVCCNANLLH